MLQLNKHLKKLTIILIPAVVAVNSANALTTMIPDNLQNHVAISIVDLNDNQNIYSYRDAVPMLLASNMKVVTSYVALNALGRDFIWKTRLAYSGTIAEHILHGNLYLIGGGDPSLSREEVKNLLHSLKDHGITQIDGNIIIDSHIFNHNVTTSELQPEPLAEYEVNPAGLIIDSNLSRVKIIIRNGKIKLKSSQNGNFKFKNLLKVAKISATCPFPDNYLNATLTTNNQITVQGNIPASCNNKSFKLNLLPAYQYDKIVIRQLLTQQKVKFSGKIRNGVAPKATHLLDENSSLPLSSLLITMNKDSNNLYAKTLFLSLGAYKTNNKNTYQDSQNYYHGVLDAKFSFPELTLENGAGLSRKEQLSPLHMTELLSTFYRTPESSLFLSSLPTPGDGTLQNEFIQYKNRLFVKTGSLNDVKAYSGYYIGKSNHIYAISFIANGINASNSQESQLIAFKQLFANTLQQLN